MVFLQKERKKVLTQNYNQSHLITVGDEDDGSNEEVCLWQEIHVMTLFQRDKEVHACSSILWPKVDR